MFLGAATLATQGNVSSPVVFLNNLDLDDICRCVNALSWAADGEFLISGGDDTTYVSVSFASWIISLSPSSWQSTNMANGR